LEYFIANAGEVFSCDAGCSVMKIVVLPPEAFAPGTIERASRFYKQMIICNLPGEVAVD
jgi:hypothetical protein